MSETFGERNKLSASPESAQESCERKFHIVARQSESPALESRLQTVQTLASPTVGCEPPEGRTPSGRPKKSHTLRLEP